MAAGAGSGADGGAGSDGAARINAIVTAIWDLDADFYEVAARLVRYGSPVPASVAHCRGLLESARFAVAACLNYVEHPAIDTADRIGAGRRGDADGGTDRPGPALRSVDRLLRDGEDG